jgi:hypothetical protein
MSRDEQAVFLANERRQAEAQAVALQQWWATWCAMRVGHTFKPSDPIPPFAQEQFESERKNNAPGTK